MKTTTTQFSPIFSDWRDVSRNDHQLSNSEILARFGNHPDQPDAANATMFRGEDVDHENWRYGYHQRTLSQFYRHLDFYNQGMWNWKCRNDLVVTRQQKQHLIQIIGSQLELNSWQLQRALIQFMSLNLSEKGVKMEMFAYAICAYAVHSDYKAGISIRKCHPRTPTDERDALFVWLQQRLHNSLGITEKQLESTYGKVQHLFRNWSDSRLSGSPQNEVGGGGGI